MANDRHESDKLFVQYIINTELIPRLPLISSAYAPLAGLELDWDESEDMDTNTFITNVVQLTQAGYEIDPQQITDKTGINITGKLLKTPNNLSENGKKKNLSL